MSITVLTRVAVFGSAHPKETFWALGDFSWIVQCRLESPGGATSGLAGCLDRLTLEAPHPVFILLCSICVYAGNFAIFVVLFNGLFFVNSSVFAHPHQRISRH